MAAPRFPHPDHITGLLSELLGVIARPVTNTLQAVDVYRGLSAAELFPPPPRALPDLGIQGRWKVPGLMSEDLVFQSQHVPLEPEFRRRYQTEYKESHQVYARRIRPTTARQRPRLLYLHGYMQPETYIEEVSLLSAMALRLDMEIIQIQPPYHGRRAPRGSRFSGELFWTADLVRSIEALRQSVLDSRTLLSLLLAEDDRPVGVSGLSLGGALALTLTCLEDRFAFSVPLIAHMDLAALVADAPVLGRMRRDLRSFGWTTEDFNEFVAALGWNDLRPQIPIERILLVAASEDGFFDPQVVEAMWKRWGEPAIRWYPTSHMGFLPYLPAALGSMREFIDACTPHTTARRRRPATAKPRRRSP